MKTLKIAITDEKPQFKKVEDHITPEGWWAAVKRSDAKLVDLNGTMYPKEKIINVTEEKPQYGSTNMEGV